MAKRRSRKPGVFLSHTANDKGFVRVLAEDLQAAGARVWIDEAEIQVGDSLIEKIRQGIDKMDFVAAILSPDSINSEWVKRELDIAMNQEIEKRRMKVLPLLYRQCKLPGFLKGKFYADFTQEANYTTALHSVLRALGLPRKQYKQRSRSSYMRSPSRNSVRAEELLRQNLWVGYEPTDFSLYKQQECSREAIEEDLAVLKKHGFSGIITFGLDAGLDAIPAIAKRIGLKVIQGVGSYEHPDDWDKLGHVAPSIDAICVGHHWPGRRSWSRLRELIADIKKQTELPITTTLHLADHDTPDGLACAELCDFLLPCVHVEWREEASVEETIKKQLESVAYVHANRSKVFLDKPVMLKMISFPSGGVSNANGVTHNLFYKRWWDRFFGDPGFPADIWFSFFTAFDAPWKDAEHGWPACFSMTGIFNADRSPKPAVQVFEFAARRLFPNRQHL